MFNSLKKLFGRRVETTTEPREHRTPTPSGLTLAPGYTPRTAARPESQPRAGIPATLSIPLKTIIARLPADLMQRVRHKEVGEVEIPISMQKVLSQIAQGAVKISFGELRQLAPQGTFSAETDLDRSLVDLPLHEVLARMNLALLPRRPSQRHIEVPAEVTGPFGSQCRAVISNTPMKPVTPAPAPELRPQAPPPRNPPPPIPAPPISAPPVQRAQPTPIVARLRNGGNGTPPVPERPSTPVPAPAPQDKDTLFKPVFNRIDRPAATPPSAPVSPMAPKAPKTPIVPMAPIAPAELPTDEESLEEEPPIFSPITPTSKPTVPKAPSAPIPMPEVARYTPRPSAPIAPAAPVIPVATASAAPVIPKAKTPEPESAPIRFTPPPPPPPEVLAARETRFLTVSLSELAIVWPDAIKDQIVLLNATNSSVALPMGLTEAALKTGKIAYSWKTIRAWIKPPLPATASAQDAVMLDLPLRVIAPLFLGEMKGVKAQNRIELDDEIPDLFFDGTTSDASAAPVPLASPAAPAVAPPPPVAPAAIAAAAPAPRPVMAAPVMPIAPAAPAAPKAPPAPIAKSPVAPIAAAAPAAPAKNSVSGDTNFFSRRDEDEEDDGEEESEEQGTFLKKDGTPGTAFLKRYATPNDIVNKAAALGGVDGALIALPDGLLVACKIPASMNADTIAGFLPQIFTKVNQCTRELRLGDLNNLNFTVGNVPWKIFKVGAIFFAAFGRAGEAMPTAQLARLAVDLDHKGK